MHFAQNASMILLGGIFDGFTMPSSYWAVMLIETAMAAALVVIFFGSKTLTRRFISPRGTSSLQLAR